MFVLLRELEALQPLHHHAAGESAGCSGRVGAGVSDGGDDNVGVLSCGFMEFNVIRLYMKTDKRKNRNTKQRKKYYLTYLLISLYYECTLNFDTDILFYNLFSALLLHQSLLHSSPLHFNTHR